MLSFDVLRPLSYDGHLHENALQEALVQSCLFDAFRRISDWSGERGTTNEHRMPFNNCFDNIVGVQSEGIVYHVWLVRKHPGNECQSLWVIEVIAISVHWKGGAEVLE